MKKAILLLLILATGSTVFGVDDEIKTKSRIQEVTVFLRGAQVTRTGTVNLPAGAHYVVFDNLSPHIDPNSIQVEGNERFTILSVNYRQNFLEAAASEEKTKKLVKQREELELRQEMRSSVRSVYREERNMLLANQKISGTEESMLIEDLVEMADFYRGRLKDIEFKLLEIEQELKRIQKEKDAINRQLSELHHDGGKNTGEVVVQLSAKAPASVRMQISFIVRKAGWVPEYDIRSDDIGGPVNLTYKGRVWQNSGNDWNQVKIKLNTGNPTVNNTQPTMTPQVLSIVQPIQLRGGRTRAQMEPKMAEYERKEVAAEEEVAYSVDEIVVLDDFEATESLASYTTVENAGVVTEFDVDIPYTIPSDEQEYTVEVQTHKLPVKYNYFAAPKFDCDAFLLARVTGWDQLNLLAGNANVFYQGTYVGKSYVNPQNTSDTLDVSLGRDKGIVVTRKKAKDYSKTSGSTTKTELAIDITLRNNKSKQAILTLEDQIPISRNKELEVDMIEAVGADYNETTGKLVWKVILQPGESKTYTLRYTVKRPKDKKISNL